MKILILFAHPAFHKSKVNKELIKGISDLEHVTFHDLYEAYPELDIDVQREQELLSGHDVVLFHFPFFWYSTPAILKEWQDLVLEHGWAYGSKGIALKDKIFSCIISTGGPKAAYQHGNFHDHTILELILPLRQTASLCKMNVLPPFVIHGSHAITREALGQYREDYFSLLRLLSNDELNVSAAGKLDYLNDYLK